MVRYNCPIEGKLYKTTEDIKVGTIITCPGCGYDLKFINLKEALAKVEVVEDTSEWVGTYKCPWDGGKYGLTEDDKVGDIINCPGCGGKLKIKNIDGDNTIVEEFRD